MIIGDDYTVSKTPVHPSTRTLAGDPYAEHITTRLKDFFAASTPWNRRLWDTGLLVTLQELDEAAEWATKNVLSAGAVKFLANDITRIAGRDSGVGDRDMRIQLQENLKSGVRHGTRHHRTLLELTSMIRDGYVERWAAAVGSANPPSAERCSRALAAHLLDRGYSMPFLYRWVKNHTTAGHSLGDLLDSAGELARGTSRKFEVFVPFESIPQAPDLLSHLTEWMDPGRASEWLHLHADSIIRQNGAFLYSISAMDPLAAAEQGRRSIDRIIARTGYTRRTGRGDHIPNPSGRIWIWDGLKDECTDVLHEERISRGAYVLSLQSEKRIYDVGQPTALDDALELAAPLNNGSPGPAISGGWAAIEALLVAPEDPEDSATGRGVVAADRMAALVASSWPRAEFTALSHQHRPTTPDRLALDLDRAETNQDRARLVAKAVEAGHLLSLTRSTDRASEQRMIKLVHHPRATLQDVRGHVTTALRRLYRQRNLLMHGGSTGSVALAATLRTTAPLVGAGLDRITHASLIEGISPLQLASRAQLNLRLAGGQDGRPLVDLLD